MTMTTSTKKNLSEEAELQLSLVGKLTAKLMEMITSNINVDTDAIMQDGFAMETHIIVNHAIQVEIEPQNHAQGHHHEW